MSDAARSPAEAEENVEDTPVTVKLKVVPRVATKSPAAPVVPIPRTVPPEEAATSAFQITARRLSPGISDMAGEPVRPTRATEPTIAGPHLKVVRGQKVNVVFPLRTGENAIGRAGESPVEVDIEGQEPADRIWASRRHAVIRVDGENAEIEDLESLNGTFVNRLRLPPGVRRPLKANDIIQVGTIQLRFRA